MASFLDRSLVLISCLILLVILVVGGLPSPGSALGLPRPQPNLNFTIGVEGVVWCKSCRYRGNVESSRDASPLRNAAALLRCRHGRRALSVWNTTEAHGYFLIQTGTQAAPFTSSNCKVYVPRSPARGRCRVAVSPGRRKGWPLKFRRFVTLTDGLQARYSAGRLTFAPPQDRSKCQ